MSALDPEQPDANQAVSAAGTLSETVGGPSRKKKKKRSCSKKRGGRRVEGDTFDEVECASLKGTMNPEGGTRKLISDKRGSLSPTGTLHSRGNRETPSKRGKQPTLNQ